MFEGKFTVAPADVSAAAGAVNWLSAFALVLKYGPAVAQLVQQILADLGKSPLKLGAPPAG